MRRTDAMLLLVGAALIAGCKKPQYDTSTPQATVASMQQMVQDGHPEELLELFWIEPRDITFADGVTEESAIGEVRAKAKDMVAQLWRVSTKLKKRYPKEVAAELASGQTTANRGGFGGTFSRIMTDPFGWLDANKERLKVEDLGDGTATVEIDGKPVLGGTISMVERPDGWKVTIPVELVRTTEYFPDTREEWAVVAYMMLAIENAMNDFERELDSGKFKTLSAASERVGRLIGEGAAAQAIIYAMMQQNQPGKEKPAASMRIRDGKMEVELGRAGDAMRRNLVGP